MDINSCNGFWYNKEYVSEIKRSLWHVWQKGVTHSTCVSAFENEELAETYCNYLNKEQV